MRKILLLCAALLCACAALPEVSMPDAKAGIFGRIGYRVTHPFGGRLRARWQARRDDAGARRGCSNRRCAFNRCNNCDCDCASCPGGACQAPPKETASQALPAPPRSP